MKIKLKVDWFVTGIELGVFPETWSWSETPDIPPIRFIIVEVRMILFHATLFLPLYREPPLRRS